MSTSQRGDKDMAIYTCKKDGGGCGGRTIQIPDLEPLMEKLLFKRLEEVEALSEKDPDDPRPALEAKVKKWERRKEELEEELIEGDRPAREIRDAIDKLNARVNQARGRPRSTRSRPTSRMSARPSCAKHGRTTRSPGSSRCTGD